MMKGCREGILLLICGMKASKDTIETLVRSVAETNRELYCSMREDVSIF